MDTHKTEIKIVQINDVKDGYHVHCSCGFEDPMPGSLLITRGDAEASERDHLHHVAISSDHKGK